MHVDGGTGRFLHTAQSDHMIDVRMRHHDCCNFQMMSLDHFQDTRRVVARIDDDCFAGLWISDDMAIALQHADGKDFVNESWWFPHVVQYSIGWLAGSSSSHQQRYSFCYDGIVNVWGFGPNMPLEPPLLDLHRSAGATIGEYFGTKLPARF